MGLPPSRVLKSLALSLWLWVGSGIGAMAQGVDEQAFVTNLIAGRYDRLAALESAARGGDPVAMHWWGVLLDACAIDETCRRDEADAWWRKAALAGHSPSRTLVYLRSAGQATALDPYVGIGEPRTSEERLVWSAGILGTMGADPALNAAALSAVEQVDATQPTMLSMQMNLLHGRGNRIAAARALLAAGTPFERQVGEMLRRQYLVREGKRYPQLLAMAQGGDAVAALALCASTDVMEGNVALPPALHPMCVAAFDKGHFGLAAILLRHHLERGEMEEAGRWAERCWSLPVSCGDAIADYEQRRPGGQQTALMRDAELAAAGGMQVTSAMPLAARQRGLALRIRRQESQRACLRRAYDPGRNAFAAEAGCPWGKPPG